MKPGGVMCRWLFGLLFTGLLGAGCASTPAAASAAAPPAASEEKAFLWEARKDDTVVFLVGSIHLGKKDALTLSPSMEDALAASDALVVEVDAAGADPALLQQVMAQKGRLAPEQPNLREQLEPADRKKFEALLTETGVPLQAADRLQPWVAAIILVMNELAKAEFDPQSGVDEQFLRRARGQKQVIELESLEEQLSIFSDMPHDEQLLMLQEQLRTTEGDATAMLSRLVAAWAKGDAAAMEKELLSEMKKPEYEKLYRRIFTDRNHSMAKKIGQLVATNPTKKHFVVVGAGHVVGPEGLIELLEAEGYRVTQLQRGTQGASGL